MFLRLGSAVGVALMMAAFTGTALADEWVAERLRGKVLVLENQSWEPLERGDIVDDASPIRTLRSGRVTLRRGNEVIELAGETQVRIIDAAGTKSTTVVQDFGTVSIEAERRNVQHFAVRTPFLAAVVKGTEFTVAIRGRGTRVSVEHGVVEVIDTVHGLTVDVPAGQDASVFEDRGLDVSGMAGEVVVHTLAGAVVPVASLEGYVENLAGSVVGEVERGSIEIDLGGVDAGVSPRGLALGVGQSGTGGLRIGIGGGNAGGNGNGNANGHDDGDDDGGVLDLLDLS
jgi:hypothetical protein